MQALAPGLEARAYVTWVELEPVIRSSAGVALGKQLFVDTPESWNPPRKLNKAGRPLTVKVSVPDAQLDAVMVKEFWKVVSIGRVLHATAAGVSLANPVTSGPAEGNGGRT